MRQINTGTQGCVKNGLSILDLDGLAEGLNG
jgi:hypothetical protein